MGQANKLLSNLSNIVDRAMVGIVFLIMAGLVIVTTLQVVFRVAFNALTWSEEMSRYLLVWGTFFGATLAYKRGNHIAVTFNGANEVKFYINPFAGGAVFTRKEILLYLDKAEMEVTPACFEPADNKTVLQRWCRELMQAYLDKGVKDKARELRTFIRILG